MKKLSFTISSCAAIAALIILSAAPAQASEYARRGLSLCAQVIIPSLLPFFAVSAAISALGLPLLFGRVAEPAMRSLFGVSGACCAPFVLGLAGGYPIGASATADLVRSGAISPQEGERLLPFCNNTGPAFIIGAVGSGVFASPAFGLLLYLNHIFAAAAVGILFSCSHSRVSSAPDHTSFQIKSLPQLLPGCIKGAALSTLNICSFVVFFSVVSGMLEWLGIFSAAAGCLSTTFGAELSFCRALLTGILELGSGIGAMLGLSPSPCNLALASFILGFGSLSVHCQTLAAIEGTGMKCARHFAGRILHALISALLTYVISTLLQT